MMRPWRYPPLLLWAVREVQRRSGRSLLQFSCLSGLVFLIATALLFSRAMDVTWTNLLQTAPDLIVRRIDAGGWAPLPAAAATAAAQTVPGVIDATPRLWGVVVGPDGPLTVVANLPGVAADLPGGTTPPADGQAVVGQGVKRALKGSQTGRNLTLTGLHCLTVAVTDVFPADSGLATHDLVWVTPGDARRLLGLAPGQASDLAVRLFRREEAQAIQADLAAALPWPVHIVDRGTSAWRHHMRAVRTGGIVLVAGIPALLALLLIITDTAVASRTRMAGWGLLKAMGWTSADIVRLQVYQAALVGLPALTVGLGAAYAVVFLPTLTGVTARWITGGMHLPALSLDPGGAVLVMLEVVAMVGLPYLATVYLTALHRVAGDPWSMLQADPWN